MKVIVFAAVVVGIVLAGCSSRQVMKDCQRLDGDWFTCRKP